jgi:hypothetical protein
MTVTELPRGRRSASRFSGRPLSDLLGEPVGGVFDDEEWDTAGHPDTASSVRQRLHFDRVPLTLRDAFKELFGLATRPHLHGDVTSDLVGRKPKDLKTVERWLGGLAIDLAWLAERAGCLVAVTQADLDEWKDTSGLRPDYRRISAIKSFALYSRAMTPGIDRLVVDPWPGISALTLGGGVAATRRRVNSTAPLSVTEVLGPWLTLGMFLVENAGGVIDGYEAAMAGQTPAPVLVTDTAGHQVVWLDADVVAERARELLGQIAGACMFLTAAFTGMRATEVDAIPRFHPLEPIEVAGATRWLLSSHLVKAQQQPRLERWLVPPIVAEAVRVTGRILEAKGVPTDRLYAATGKPPLFDRRALHGLRDGAKTTARLGRAIDLLGRAGQDLVARSLVPPLPGADGLLTAAVATRLGRPKWEASLVKPDGRELRRTFTRVVAARPQGPQAAMEQFKWQHPETAAAYFRVSPDAVAVRQRELYDEVSDLYQEVVVDAMVSEYHLWERLVDGDARSLLPAGPDGRRKRDMFAAVREALAREPRVEEDDRRLRLALRRHARSIRLTEFGWCDFDPQLALCGADSGAPVEARCQPSRCLNHSTVTATLAAHQVKHDRLLALARDRSMPDLARVRARDDVELIERDLGELISRGTT